MTFIDINDINFASMWQTECYVHLNLSSENIDSDDDLSAVWEERDDPVPAVPGTSCASSNDHHAERGHPVPAVPGTPHVSSIFLHQAHYDNYVDLIDEDQDPDFLAAIEASLLDKQTATSCDASDPELQPREDQSLNLILTSFQADNLQQPPEPDKPVSIIISRKSVLPTTLRAIEGKTFSFFQPVTVTFAGEEAVDAGTPKREFFRLFMSSIRGSSVFSGPWFSRDLNQLSGQKYALAGKLVAWSVLQGNNGP